MAKGRGRDTPVDEVYLRKLTKYAVVKIEDAESASDLVQTALLRCLKSLGEVPSRAYLDTALRTVLVDRLRENSRGSIIKDPTLEDHPDFPSFLMKTTTADDRRLLRLRGDGRPWTAVATELNASSEAVRKRHQRLHDGAKAELLLTCLKRRDYMPLNQYRTPYRVMQEAAKRMPSRGLSLQDLIEPFDAPAFNRVIQTAVWGLAEYRDAQGVDEARNILKGQLENRELFRGSRYSIIEAVMKRDASGWSPWLEESKGLLKIQDMQSRIVSDNRTPREQEPISKITLFDQISFESWNPFVSQDIVDHYFASIAKGVDDVDLRRTLTWFLLRSRPQDARVVDLCLEVVRAEQDQINAYYVVKFIRSIGLKNYRRLYLTSSVLQTLRLVAKRWPQNPYFAQSAARTATALRRA